MDELDSDAFLQLAAEKNSVMWQQEKRDVERLFASHFSKVGDCLDHNRRLRGAWVFPGYVYLQRLNDTVRARSVDGLIDLQSHLFRVCGPVDMGKAPPWKSTRDSDHVYQIYCRLLLGSIIHICDKDLCAAAFTQVQARLHPSLLAMNVESGICEELGFISGGRLKVDFVDPEMGRRMMSCLLLFGRVPKAWEGAVLRMSIEYLERSYDWINYLLEEFPRSFWEWADARIKGDEGTQRKQVLQLVSCLCQNVQFAAECIRLGIMKILLARVLREQTSELESLLTNLEVLQRTVVHRDATTLRLICVLACLEIPEFDHGLELELLRLASIYIKIPVPQSTFVVELACFCNPRLASLIRKEGMEHQFGTLFRKTRVIDRALMSLCLKQEEPHEHSQLERSIKRFSRAKSSMGRAKEGGNIINILRNNRSCDSLVKQVVFCDSMLKLLIKYNAPEAPWPTLLRVLLEKGAHVAWIGVLKRIGFDLNTVNRSGSPIVLEMTGPSKTGGVNRDWILAMYPNLRVSLLLDPDLDVGAKDAQGKSHAHQIGAVGFFCLKNHVAEAHVLLRFAKAGLFETTFDVSFLYIPASDRFLKWMYWDRFRAIWMSRPRLAPDWNSFVSMLITRFGGDLRIQLTYLSAIIRASFLCGVMAMRVNRPARRTPIAWLSTDILAKLFRDHFRLPDTGLDPIVTLRWPDRSDPIEFVMF